VSCQNRSGGLCGALGYSHIAVKFPLMKISDQVNNTQPLFTLEANVWAFMIRFYVLGALVVVILVLPILFILTGGFTSYLMFPIMAYLVSKALVTLFMAIFWHGRRYLSNIKLEGGILSGPKGVFNPKLVSFSLDNLDNKRLEQRSYVEKILGYRALWSLQGEKIDFHEILYPKQQNKALIETLGLDNTSLNQESTS
jgi:hypothetical protein